MSELGLVGEGVLRNLRVGLGLALRWSRVDHRLGSELRRGGGDEGVGIDVPGIRKEILGGRIGGTPEPGRVGLAHGG